MKSRILKILAVLFTLLFLVFAGVQYNDPDPLIWYVIYGFAALVSLLYVAGRLPTWVAVTAGILFLVGGVFVWPAQFEGVTIGGGDIKNIEEGRESLGLFLTAVIMLVYALSLSKLRKKA